MCIQNMRLKMMAVSDLKPNGFNPRSRTWRKTKKYRDLLASIREHRVLAPLLIAPDGLVIDGHRRLACAIDLGLPDVPCVIVSVNAQLAWTQAVFTQQGMNGAQVIEATARGLSIEYLPPALAGRVTELQEITDTDFYQQMASMGISVSVLVSLKRVCKYTGDSSIEWRKRVLQWLVKNKMQFDIRKAIDSDPLNENGTRERMREAINRCVPLKARYE